MPRPFPLQPLLDLSRERTEEAALKLQRLSHKLQQARKQLETLEGYQLEYQARLQQQSNQGMDVAQWRDYQLFLEKLKLAIQQQGEEVSRCEANWKLGQEAWLAHRHKEKAFEVLSQQHLQNELKRENKIEQREQDEFASAHHQNKHTKNEE